MTIEQTVKSIRSKNAGPFWVTIDAFCHDVEETKKVAAALDRNKDSIAKTFGVDPKDIKLFCLTNINVAKLSLPRIPIEGARDERDMHGGQQYVSLLDYEV